MHTYIVCMYVAELIFIARALIDYLQRSILITNIMPCTSLHFLKCRIYFLSPSVPFLYTKRTNGK